MVYLLFIWNYVLTCEDIKLVQLYWKLNNATTDQSEVSKIKDAPYEAPLEKASLEKASLEKDPV